MTPRRPEHLLRKKPSRHHYCVEVAQLALVNVVDRAHRSGNPLKPAMTGNLTWACRIDGSGRDQLAEGDNKSVCAVYLLPDLLIPH